MAITNATITSSPASIYTSTNNNAITTIIICNTSLSDYADLSLYALPSGGNAASPASNSMIVNTLRIPAGETLTFDQEKMVLSNGDMIVASASGDGTLVATISTLAV